MEPLQILLMVLVVAGIWFIAELAITARRARRTMDGVDKTVAELNETLAEARPVVAKLDGAVDELQPAIAKIDPLLSSANVAVDALSANLVEIEGVVRDVSAVTGAAASAGNAVTGVADSATEAARKLFGKIKSAERAIEGVKPEQEVFEPAEGDTPADEEHAPAMYFTYGDAPQGEAAASDEPQA